jgi:hypothetical protein
VLAPPVPPAPGAGTGAEAPSRNNGDVKNDDVKNDDVKGGA